MAAATPRAARRLRRPRLSNTVLTADMYISSLIWTSGSLDGRGRPKLTDRFDFAKYNHVLMIWQGNKMNVPHANGHTG
jgi:hypothetical protein